MKQWKSPPPTNEDNIEERRRKKIAGIIMHNSPAELNTVKMLYSRSQPLGTLDDLLEDLTDEGYVEKTEDGKYVVTDRVE